MPARAFLTVLFRLGVLAVGAWACLAGAKEGGSGPAVGSAAPDFTAYSFIDGTKTRLSEQQGKVVILTFWATWCPPCREELPNLEGIQEHVGRDQLVVLAVSYHDTEDRMDYLRKSAKKAGWRMSMLKDPDSVIAERYGVSGIPHLVLIGRDGRIAAIHSGFGDDSVKEFLPQLNAALAARPAAQAQPAAQ